MSTETHADDETDLNPVQRTVPAAAAAKPAAIGPTSAFDLASKVAPDAPQAEFPEPPPAVPKAARPGLNWRPGQSFMPETSPRKAGGRQPGPDAPPGAVRMSRAERCQQAIDAITKAGELKPEELAAQLVMSLPAVRKVIQALASQSRIEPGRVDGRLTWWRVATGKPQVSAKAAKAAKKRQDKPAAAAPVPAPASSPSGLGPLLDALVPRGVDVHAFRGGLFSDGTVEIAGARGKLTMSAIEARDALRWLTRMDAALREVAA